MGEKKLFSPFLTAKEAAEYLRYTVDALASMRAAGRGPRYYQPDGLRTKVLYKVEDLDSWVAGGGCEESE